MKKLLCVGLCLLVAFCLIGCNKADGQEIPSNTVENLSASVAESVSKGVLPEVNFKLGDSVSELKNYYDDTEAKLEEEHKEDDGHVHSDSDIMLKISQGNLSVTYEIGDEKYYYEKEKKSKGISVICSLTDAFGIKHGTLKSDVEATLSDLELKSFAAGEDELYFVQLTEALILRYKSGNYIADFYFNNNALVATVLRNTENWTI